MHLSCTSENMAKIRAFLLVLALAPGLAAAALPSFRFADLGASASDEVIERLSIALTTVGALQITSIPRFREARLAALGPLAQCLWKNKEGANLTKMVMPDGAPRLTTHAASTRGAASAFGSACGDSAAELREAIDAGTRQLLLSLDKARMPAVDVSPTRRLRTSSATATTSSTCTLTMLRSAALRGQTDLRLISTQTEDCSSP